jgi:hypothetical protein
VVADHVNAHSRRAGRTAAAEKASGYTGLYEAMIVLYPDRVNRAVPWHSAKAFLA